MTWAGVRKRVGHLARRHGAASVFGAAEHRFRLDPALSERDVAAVEEQFGAVVPAEYRGFLLEVGARGAGPGYGLFGFRRANGRWGFAGDQQRGHDQVDLRTAFPHRTDLPPPRVAGSHRRPGIRAARVRAGPGRPPGSGDPGHAAVVPPRVWSLRPPGRHRAGPRRGVGGRGSRDGGIGPLADPPGRTTFDRWYLGWLDSAEAGLERLSRDGERRASWSSRR
ncbi:SMI1/KNR4 family protein [Amycolatopsis sp. FDAARGOS 1241]|uniref:SMI1/KNR4 family protein n=1 Tax=Amycolatopsis sp. FDAARGOS 1241 TaxID=2778070 RepID=UPI00195214B9|nr:SMI1/KNR4 family protein [Amycolatopsis sp. FDAARGOS 1241]QRP49654.1 hypothetical protein I6J71_19085 [Amycolatopsis sp. FDAARGOS 1241]